MSTSLAEKGTSAGKLQPIPRSDVGGWLPSDERWCQKENKGRSSLCQGSPGAWTQQCCSLGRVTNSGVPTPCLPHQAERKLRPTLRLLRTTRAGSGSRSHILGCTDSTTHCATGNLYPRICPPQCCCAAGNSHQNRGRQLGMSKSRSAR